MACYRSCRLVINRNLFFTCLSSLFFINSFFICSFLLLILINKVFFFYFIFRSHFILFLFAFLLYLSKAFFRCLYCCCLWIPQMDMNVNGVKIDFSLVIRFFFFLFIALLFFCHKYMSAKMITHLHTICAMCVHADKERWKKTDKNMKYIHNKQRK